MGYLATYETKAGPGESMIHGKPIITHITLFLALCLLINPIIFANGKPIPGRWEKVQSLDADEKITIVTRDGEKQRCKLKYVDNKSLHGYDKEKDDIAFDLIAIDKVIHHRAKKDAKKGTLYGLLGGTILGGLIAIANPGDGHNLIFPYLIAGGTVAGLAVGLLATSPETIYISKETDLREAGK